jgi:hypothetical protein
VRAESLGYDRISVPEVTGRDVVTVPQLFTPTALADRMDDLRGAPTSTTGTRTTSAWP